MADRLANSLLACGLVVLGGLAWWLQLRPAPKADPAPLAALPLQIGSWQGHDISLDGAVERVLNATFHVQRSYVHPVGSIVWLYVGYYDTARGGRPEHTPRGCYTGAGWGITSADTISIDPATDLRGREFVVERDGARQLVLYWYRSYRQTGMTGGFDQNWDRLVGRLLHGRADGALVRLSAPLVGDVDSTRLALRAFASQLDRELASHWPSEVPV